MEIERSCPDCGTEGTKFFAAIAAAASREGWAWGAELKSGTDGGSGPAL